MIAVLKHTVTEAQLEHLKGWLNGLGLGVHISRGSYQTVVGLPLVPDFVPEMLKHRNREKVWL